MTNPHVPDTAIAPPMVLATGRIGPFRLEREVGSGSAGVVYRAVDDRTNTVVALKYVTEPDWRARFGREVETLSRLVHPGIVRYITHGEALGGLFLVMEWLDGEDLAHRLTRGRMSWQETRALGLRLTSALAHAHGLGAVHRDLNPRNIFLPGGRVEEAKLLDFGIVRLRDQVDRTATQSVVGSPHYMAPEQIKDPRAVDARSDLFALGVVFYEMISGYPPFDGGELFTVWKKIVDDPTPNLRNVAPPDLPDALVQLIERLLSKDPAHRPSNAMEVHHALLQMDERSSARTLAQGPSMHPGAITSRPSNPYLPPSYTSLPPGPAMTGNAPFVSMPAPAAPSGIGHVGAIVAAILAAAVIVAAAVIGIFYFVWHESVAAVNTPVAIPTIPPTPSPLSTVTEIPSGIAKDDTQALTCFNGNVEHRVGGHYVNPNSAAPSVTVMSGCKAILENCTIGGEHSILMMGGGELTLRHCTVKGDAQLMGNADTGTPALTLDGTLLATQPKIIGLAHIYKR